MFIPLCSLEGKSKSVSIRACVPHRIDNGALDREDAFGVISYQFSLWWASIPLFGLSMSMI